MGLDKWRATFVLQFTEPRTLAGNIGHGLESSSRSGRNRGAAAEADAIRELAVAETDAIGAEQQLCTESCQAPDYSCI